MTVRQATGLVLLVAVLIGSLAIARIGGVRVGGTAVAKPGAGAPTVGDCLIDVTGPLTVFSRGAFPPSPVSVASVGETSVTFSDCVGEHVGEVVAYRRTPGSNENAASNANTDGEWCRDVAAGYRSHTIWRFRSASDGMWEPAVGQRFVAVLSAPTRDSAQAGWAACAVLSPGLESYVGSFVQSLADQPAPAPFGLCSSGDTADRWVSCAAPHRVQEFGTATGPGMSSRAAIESCRSLIAQMTGMRDVNGGGVLRIEVIGGGPPSGGSDAGGGDFGGFGQDDPGEVGRCQLSVVGPNQLVGTLIGVADGPLPLS